MPSSIAHCQVLELSDIHCKFGNIRKGFHDCASPVRCQIDFQSRKAQGQSERIGDFRRRLYYVMKRGYTFLNCYRPPITPLCIYSLRSYVHSAVICMFIAIGHIYFNHMYTRSLQICDHSRICSLSVVGTKKMMQFRNIPLERICTATYIILEISDLAQKVRNTSSLPAEDVKASRYDSMLITSRFYDELSTLRTNKNSPSPIIRNSFPKRQTAPFTYIYPLDHDPDMIMGMSFRST
jgi:hypothetical protein